GCSAVVEARFLRDPAHRGSAGSAAPRATAQGRWRSGQAGVCAARREMATWAGLSNKGRLPYASAPVRESPVPARGPAEVPARAAVLTCAAVFSRTCSAGAGRIGCGLAHFQRSFMHIHILGICGTFMGSLAVLAKELGHRVTGSDANVYPPMSTQLQAQ